jgi:hypothetical protein
MVKSVTITASQQLNGSKARNMVANAKIVPAVANPGFRVTYCSKVCCG